MSRTLRFINWSTTMQCIHILVPWSQGRLPRNNDESSTLGQLVTYQAWDFLFKPRMLLCRSLECFNYIFRFAQLAATVLINSNIRVFLCSQITPTPYIVRYDSFLLNVNWLCPFYDSCKTCPSSISTYRTNIILHVWSVKYQDQSVWYLFHSLMESSSLVRLGE